MFNKTNEEWKACGGLHTASEIYQQPTTWIKTMVQIKQIINEIYGFIDHVMDQDDYQIIFTGAGTSEFIGNALAPYINQFIKGNVYSYATTDIVSSPRNYFNKQRKTLLVSFARSGNSPESVAAVKLADEILKENVYHLFITCNKDGELAKISQYHKRAFLVLLAQETNDVSLAMTSSYTNMMLAGMLIFDRKGMKRNEADMNDVIKNVCSFLDKGQDVVNEIISKFEFDRIIYLGSDVLKAIAEETQLKMLELSAGKVTTMYHSSLGFRHGPKSILNKNTLVICFVSDDEYTRKYDKDIINEICASGVENKVIAIMNHDDEMITNNVDASYAFHMDKLHDNMILAFAFATFGQVMALKKAVDLGNKPDTPSPTGQINRVVEGVTIYPYCK